MANRIIRLFNKYRVIQKFRFHLNDINDRNAGLDIANQTTPYPKVRSFGSQ